MTNREYSAEEMRRMLDDHEQRLTNLEPLTHVVELTKKMWFTVKVGGPAVALSIVTNVRPDTPLGKFMHGILPWLY